MSRRIPVFDLRVATDDRIVRSGGVPVLAGFVGSPLVFQYEMIGGPERGLYRFRFYEGFVAIGAHRTKTGP